MNHSTRARRALAQLAEVDPGLGALALWCKHRDGTGPTRTMEETIFYGDDFERLALPQQVGLTAHHVLHVALRHSARARAARERLGPDYGEDLFGLAADAIVNEALLAADHAVPRPAPVLTELLEKIGEPAESPLTALSDWDTEKLALRLHRDDKTRKAAQSYGNAKEFVPDLQEGGEGPSEDQDADWRGHMLRAMETGRQAGTGIGMLGAIIADMAPPRIPWERQLRGLLAKALIEAPQPTWRRPSGRWAAMEATARARGTPVPVFQPGRQRSQWRPRIVVGLDTSSSIAPEVLRLFAAEADGIARRTGAQTHLLAFDTEVHNQMRLHPGQRLRWDSLRLRVGGGTDFRPFFAEAAKLQPSVAVVLSDLDAPMGAAPAYPVIWVAPTDAERPAFGKLLCLAG